MRLRIFEKIEFLYVPTNFSLFTGHVGIDFCHCCVRIGDTSVSRCHEQERDVVVASPKSDNRMKSAQ